jgi:Virulence factor
VAKYHVLYWKDIPSVVEATDGGDSATVQLSERFQMLIDAVAMKLGLDGTDEYLEQWDHGDESERAGSAREVADAVARELEDKFADYRARTLGAE